MNFKKIKATRLTLPLLGLMLGLLTACGSSQIASVEEMNADVESQERYVLPNTYVEHRSQQRVFNSTGGKIAYLDYGTGPVLVLLHGVPSSSWLYRQMIEPLQKNYRVIAIDLLGFGSSDKPESNHENYQIPSQASYVTQLLSSLGIKDYNLLFHDMGGLVGWELVNNSINSGASAAPSVSNLIVLNTIIAKHGFEHPKMKKGTVARIMSDTFANQLSSAAALELTFQNMGLSANKALSENECNGYVIPMQEGNGDVLYDFYTSFDHSRFERLESQISNLSNFDGDVLVLWGAQDKVLTTQQIPVLQKAANVKSNNIHIFNDNAHFLPEEIPEILVEKIQGFAR